MTNDADQLKGREVTTGAAAPEDDPTTDMTDQDWIETWINSDGREHLLPQTPAHILESLFGPGVDTYDKIPWKSASDA